VNEKETRQIDVLAIGLFGLAVGALTLGLAQIGWIPETDKIGVLVITLVFGGVVQLLAGITDIRYNSTLTGWDCERFLRRIPRDPAVRLGN